MPQIFFMKDQRIQSKGNRRLFNVFTETYFVLLLKEQTTKNIYKEKIHDNAECTTNITYM